MIVVMKRGATDAHIDRLSRWLSTQYGVHVNTVVGTGTTILALVGDTAAVDQDAPPGRHPALALWLVPHNLPGIEVYPIKKTGQSMLPFSDVVLKDVRLDESMRLHGRRTGFPQLFHLFARPGPGGHGRCRRLCAAPHGVRCEHRELSGDRADARGYGSEA